VISDDDLVVITMDDRQLSSYIVPFQLCVFEESDTLNVSSIPQSYVSYILRNRLRDDESEQVIIERHISINHADCINIDLIDGEDKELLIFFGNGLPLKNQFRSTHRMVFSFGIINFAGLIARNNREV
jgi:hypothetical protein